MDHTLKDIMSVLSDEQKAQLNKIQQAKYAWAREERKKYDESRWVVFWTLCKINMYFLLPCFVVLCAGYTKNKNYGPFVLGFFVAICVGAFFAFWAIVTPY